MKLLTKRLAAILVLLTVVSLALASAASPKLRSRHGADPSGLTAQGALISKFEGLLRRTFGNRQVWVVKGDDFACAGACGPLSKYQPYSYVFASSQSSPFVLSGRYFKNGAFGNYPYPILVRGKSVACDAKATTFLVGYGDAFGLTLACLAPLTG